MMLRQGRKVGRTLYRMVGDEPSDDDDLVGLVDTVEMATLIVTAVNHWRTATCDARARLAAVEALCDDEHAMTTLAEIRAAARGEASP